MREICDGATILENDSIDESLEMALDVKSDMILEELVQNSLRNDLLESCERAWFNALTEKPDLIPPDSDEGSLSSGCESASTVTSELDQQVVFPTISEEFIERDEKEVAKMNKTDIDFKVGGCVLARVRSFERVNSDVLKYCGLNYSHNNNKSLLNTEEVSLIPVGESQADFSSLKVFKKRNSVESNRDIGNYGEDQEEECEGGDESACSDESGYEEEELTSSVANIVLV